MPRTKGSKNKIKEVKEVKTSTVKEPVREEPKYEPKPILKAEPPKEVCSKCPHTKQQHFNGVNWCSQQGCNCGRYESH